MIMAQTHIFNFFPGSIHSGRILKTLSLFASRQKNTYLPNQQVWLNKLYFQISNSKEKSALMLILEMLTIWGLVNFEPQQKTTANKFVILTEIIVIPATILIWLNVSTRKILFFLFLKQIMT